MPHCGENKLRNFGFQTVQNCAFKTKIYIQVVLFFAASNCLPPLDVLDKF